MNRTLSRQGQRLLQIGMVLLDRVTGLMNSEAS